MAVAAGEIKKLQKEVAALKREVAALREALTARGIRLKRNGRAWRPAARPLTAVEIARRAGLLGELTPTDKARVAE